MTDKIDLTGLTPKEIAEQFESSDGREIRIYATNGGGPCPYPIHGAVRMSSGVSWVPEAWSLDGMPLGVSGSRLRRKQPQPPQPRVLWAVYSADGCNICATDCETTAGLIANRRRARVVKMVEAV